MENHTYFIPCTSMKTAFPSHLSSVAISAVLLLCLFGLFGCAGQADTIFREYGVFKGKPIQTAFDALGYPDNKQDYGPVVVYQWITKADPCYFQIKIAADSKTGMINSVRGEGNEYGAGYYYPKIHAFYLSNLPPKPTR